MKKLLLTALVVMMGVVTANAWNDLYFLCSGNNWNQNDSYKFSKVNDNAFFYVLDAEALQENAVIFRIKDAEHDWGAWANEAIVGSAEYSAKKDETGQGFKVEANANAKFAYIYAIYKQDPSNNYEWRWHLTANIIEETTTVAFVDVDNNWATAKVYVWLADNGVQLMGGWPGTAMTHESDIYTCEVPYVAGAKIKFTDKNEGSNESFEFDMAQNAIYKYDAKVESVSAPIGVVGFATFSSAYPVDFTNCSDVTAYRAEQTSDNKVKLIKVPGKVPAATGLVLRGTANATVTIPTAITTTSIGNNNMWASVKATEVKIENLGSDYFYFLSGNTPETIGFYQITSTQTSAAGKAYYHTSTPLTNENNTSRSAWIIEDVTTGISAVQCVQNNNVLYDLQGRLANNAKAGLYIKNGKKVIVK